MASSSLEKVVVIVLTIALVPVIVSAPPLAAAAAWYFARDAVAHVFSWPFASTITFWQAFWVSLFVYIVGICIFRLVRAIFRPTAHTA